MRLLKVYILLLELLFLNTLFQSCADEYIKTDVPQQDSEIMIQVKLPGTSSLEDTRGLTDQNENHLADLMVLAFDVNGNYLYKSEARLTEEGYGGNVRTCYVSLKKGECDLMFLANCKSILNSFTIPADATKDTFRNGLPVSLSGKWNAGSNYTPLPMWGEKNEVTILPNISFKDEEAVYLIRAIAKVDVTIDRDLVPTENLQLKSILFYHGASSSHIIPDEAVWDGVNHKVTGISSGSGSYTSKNQAMEYEESDLDTDGFLTNTIYVPETSAGSENALPVTPSLVIEADYNGEASWYRIDFLDEEKNFISLLRNYRYEVKITGVQGRGYADKNEAYTARSQNLEVEIFTYQDGSLTNIMYDGQYFLAWNPKEFEFSREARSESSTDNKLTLETNYEEGWEWTKTVDKNGNEVTWVRLAAEQQSGPKDKATTVSLLIDNPNQENTKSRIAYLHFTAGRMDMSVEVTQTDQTRAWIKILDALDNEVSGSTIWVNAVEGKVAEKLLFVEWGPIGAECSVSSEKALNGDMNVVYKDGNGITDGNLTDANGIHRYYLEFRPFDRSRDYNTTRAREITRYQTKYTFTVNYNNEVITRDIIIAHHFEMFDTDINEWYYLGFEWTASFYASTSYWISVNDDRTSPILYDASQLSGLNVILQDGETRRENVSFRLKNPTMERDNRKFQINVNFYTSKEMENFHIDVKGYKVLPNSYMVEKKW
ncbi:MAG: FimB/Mfa2 family fimbrial subunit [Bacteroides sp.]|nr:FimB/Mfa2 family fimbrial subunit [Bacteroides sp.]